MVAKGFAVNKKVFTSDKKNQQLYVITKMDDSDMKNVTLLAVVDNDDDEEAEQPEPMTVARATLLIDWRVHVEVKAEVSTKT